jgi:hypothetical protein
MYPYEDLWGAHFIWKIKKTIIIWQILESLDENLSV